MTIVRSGSPPPANWSVPPGYVGLACPEPWFQMVLLLGGDPPELSGGVGGWETTERPRQVAMTTWQGVEPYQLTLGVMFDGFARRRVMEDPLRALYRAARGDDDSDPSPWWIRGIPALPADRWVLNDISAGDVIRANDMQRVRQLVTLTFLEWSPPEWIRLRKAALSPPKAKTVTATVKTGDTPARIAAKRGCKWTDIRALNPKTIKRANQVLKAGTKLRVPVSKSRGSRDKRK